MDSLKGSDAVIRNFPDSPRESSSRATWHHWGNLLGRWHLAGLTAWLLEVGRPLALVSAQLLYMGGPFLGRDSMYLAQLLESESKTVEFIDFLASARNGGSRTRQGGD